MVTRRAAPLVREGTAAAGGGVPPLVLRRHDPRSPLRMFAASLGALVLIAPLAADRAAAATGDLTTVTDDTGTFSLTIPAAWSEVWSEPAATDAGALHPSIYASPPGGMADFAGPGLTLSSWFGEEAREPDPANIGRAVPETCTVATPVGPAPLPILPNAIGGTWACGEVTFTSIQGNTADGDYLVALSMRTPTGDEAGRTAILESLTYAGATGPAELPPVETAGLTVDNPGDPARTVRLRVGRTVDQASTLTHEVSTTITGVATNEGLEQEVSLDETSTVRLVGTSRTRAAELDGSYTVVVTPTELTDSSEDADGATTDGFAPLVGVPIERSFGPDGLFAGADVAGPDAATSATAGTGAPTTSTPTSTATDDLAGLAMQLPAESISLPVTPVGVGATWTAPAPFAVPPISGTAPAQYRLDALDGDRFTVTVTMDVDLATVEPDVFTVSNRGRFTRSMTITGSLTDATDLSITRTESAQLTNVEEGTGTVYEVSMTLEASSVEAPA